MRKRKVVLRYLLFQIPGFLIATGVLVALIHFDFISKQTAFVGLLVWVLKDAILFPIVWRSYDPDANHSNNRLLGALGTAMDEIPVGGHGHVRVHGEIWRAKLLPGVTGIQAGTQVRIHEVRILTLIVEPETTPEFEAPG